MINMNTAVMHDSPIAFPGLFGDWTFTASSKAINIGGGVYWYGIIIALGLVLAVLFCMRRKEKYGITEDDFLSADHRTLDQPLPVALLRRSKITVENQ